MLTAAHEKRMLFTMFLCFIPLLLAVFDGAVEADIGDNSCLSDEGENL